MSRSTITIILLLISGIVCAQDTTAVSKDTASARLPAVIVSAYGHRRTLLQTPAAINYIGKLQLQSFADGSVLEAVNTIPGVHMEERSPGSYRLNIRGSSLRSPFGVRNVKIYYYGIPVTDPGGFSYFNQFGFYNIKSAEIIKGPGSSMYGAGTGGVLLLNSVPVLDTGYRLTVEAGSYGWLGIHASAAMINRTSYLLIEYQHSGSNGYRQQSASTHDVLSIDYHIKGRRRAYLDIHELLSSLNYQTPGALTFSEYDTAPAMARPHTAAALGAIESNAHVLQQNALAGITVADSLSSTLVASATLYGIYTRLVNPTIRNYTRTSEPHFGGRESVTKTVELGRKSSLEITEGLETQTGYVLAKTYSNTFAIDTLQSDDRVASEQVTAFLNAMLRTGDWIIEGGASVNRYRTQIKRYKEGGARLSRNYPVQFSPRVAASYRLCSDIYGYVNVARGFSPPASTEILPTGSDLNPTLGAETGWNYEAGSKGSLADGRLLYDASVFYYTLSNAIVLRKDASGADHYINAGSTSQPGFEASASYNFDHSTSLFGLVSVWGSYSHYDFRYRNFTQLNTDLSGRQLPGVAPQTAAAGLTAYCFRKLLLNINWFYSDRVSLNDTNTAHAASYHVIDVKARYHVYVRRAGMELFAGVNNLLSQKYSLGNDINAAGGRYYNAAAPRSIYAGITLSYR